jgi:hydroxyacylglutathione hydrolase
MIFRRIESPGLVHYSYIVGDQNQAIVIDPRLDADIYLEIARNAGMQITHVLETHRNEDYLIGSQQIAHSTGAKIMHSDYEDYNFEYGETIRDGEIINFGNLKLKALHTPGHTLGHMSYLLYDDEDNPWIVFTGDTLFSGDVGRTDFYEGQIEEMAGKLYDSIYNKLLPLGDGVIVCPAHGAGSVCGSNITERIWTTIGLERANNPALQFSSRDAFIENMAQPLEYPPYFRQMEKYNKIGPEIKCNLPNPAPLAPQKFMELANEAQILDVRSEIAFGAAHIPGSLFIKNDIISNFAGWFLNYEDPILLVTHEADITSTVKQLFRMGYDNISGYLKGSMTAAAKAGIKTDKVGTLDAIQLKKANASDDYPYILDIRGAEEAQDSSIPSNLRVNLTELPDNLDNIPQDEHIHVFCGSGIRSMVAASILKKAGYNQVSVILGGTSAWNAI